MQLEKITDSRKISFLMEKLVQLKTGVEIWQPISKHQKVRMNLKAWKFQNNEIFFNSQKEIEGFDSTEITYCHIANQQTVFKSQISFLSSFKMSLHLPEYFIIQEQREVPRQVVEDKELFASYHLGHHTPSIHRIFKNQFQILDFNTRGLSVRVSPQHVPNFYIGDLLTIKLPNKNQSIKEVQIKHISPVDSSHYKMGMCFN